MGDDNNDAAENDELCDSNEEFDGSDARDCHLAPQSRMPILINFVRKSTATVSINQRIHISKNDHGGICANSGIYQQVAFDSD